MVSELIEAIETAVATLANKVIPHEDTIMRAYREMVVTQRLRPEEERVRSSVADMKPAGGWEGLASDVKKALERDPSLSWDQALSIVVGKSPDLGK